MKKIVFLLLLSTSIFAQTEAKFTNGIKLPNNPISTTAPFVNVQETSGNVNKINKSDLIEVFEYASAVNLPVTGVAGKIYVTLDNNRLYRWTGTIYQDLGYVDISNKVDKVTGKSLISDAEITRLGTLANYTHPANHPPSIITQDVSNRFVTDAEKTAWNAKQSAIGYTTENIANKNVANGYAGLGSDGKLISSQLPSITISDTYVVASQVAMLGLSGAEKGDVAVRTDLNKSFILKGNSYSTLADWQELLTPTSAVTTVFGRNGAVTAQTGDYTATMVGAPSGSGTSTGTNTGDETLATIKTKLGISVLSGSNTGDQTTITGNAGTATILQTARTINGVSFNGSTNITVADATKEPTFSKNTAFNKNFGTTAGTVVEGGTLGSNAYSSTSYLPINDGARVDLDYNTKLTSGFYNSFDSNVNNPLGQGYSQLIVAKGIDTGLQIAGGFNTDNLHFRGWASSGANFTPWRKLWHDGNFNPANYLPLTGGNVTGNLNVTGNIGIGTASPQQPFVVSNSGQQGIEIYIESTTAMGIQSYNRSTSSYSLMKYDASSHLFNSNVTAPAFFQSSDRRLKTILKRDGDVAYFKWKDGRDSKTHIGYIAQEVRKNNSNQVQKGEDKMLSVNYVEILVEKVRMLEKRIEELEKK